MEAIYKLSKVWDYTRDYTKPYYYTYIKSRAISNFSLWQNSFLYYSFCASGDYESLGLWNIKER